MSQNALMSLIRTDREFLGEAVKSLAAPDVAFVPQAATAMGVLRGMANSLKTYPRLTDKQATYAADLIDRHFLTTLTELIRKAEAGEQETKKAVKEDRETNYAGNALWGIF